MQRMGMSSVDSMQIILVVPVDPQVRVDSGTCVRDNTHGARRNWGSQLKPNRPALVRRTSRDVAAMLPSEGSLTESSF